jgi:hypothetical protein
MGVYIGIAVFGLLLGEKPSAGRPSVSMQISQSRKQALVAPGRVELPTFGLGNRCSIHLSYGANAVVPNFTLPPYFF